MKEAHVLGRKEKSTGMHINSKKKKNYTLTKKIDRLKEAGLNLTEKINILIEVGSNS
jgi:hypothetical protein